MKMPLAFALLLATALLATGAEAQLDPTDVLVRRGDAEVTVADLDAVAATLPEEVRAGVLTDPQRLDMFLQNILTTRSVAREARRQGLDEDPEISARIRTQTEETLARALIERQLAGYAPDWDEAAREQYLINKASYQTGERRTIAHILIKADEDTSAEEAQARAAELRQRALDGENFSVLAEEYSEDAGSKDNGGVYEAIARGQMVKPFEEAMFALDPPGDLSDVVKTEFGFHVIKLIDVHESRALTFEEARPALIEILKERWRNTAQSDFLDSFRSEELEVNAEAMGQLRDRYTDDG